MLQENLLKKLPVSTIKYEIVVEIILASKVVREEIFKNIKLNVVIASNIDEDPVK